MTKLRHPEKVNKPINPIKRKPTWIRSKILDTQTFFKTKEVVNKNKLTEINNIIFFMVFYILQI